MVAAALLGMTFLGAAMAQPLPVGNLPAFAPSDAAEVVLPADPQEFGAMEVAGDFQAGESEFAASVPASAAQPAAVLPSSMSLPSGWEQLTSPTGLQSSLQSLLVIAVLSLAPAILLMTTSFVRIAVVLGLLRQALGTQQLPSNQVVTSLALFMTLLIMSPVWKEVYDEAIAPYSDPEIAMSMEEAVQTGIQPIRRFMIRQIDVAGNHDDVHLFYQYVDSGGSTPLESFDDVPLQVLLPAFMLSELKTAFLIGFQIYLPFLILDLVVSAVTVSMGMMMLPPTMISLPFKLMLFVLFDGWRLIVGMLLESFGSA
jgi:flagellar biosynthesis protein FliP